MARGGRQALQDGLDGLDRLGVAFDRKGDPGQAEESYTTAVTADPQCATLQDAWEARGRVRIKLGKATDARQDFERCVEISKETTTGKACARQLTTLPSAPAVNPNDARKT